MAVLYLTIKPLLGKKPDPGARILSLIEILIAFILILVPQKVPDLRRRAHYYGHSRAVPFHKGGKHRAESFYERSIKDPLTGAFNRTIIDMIEDDLDKFKHINDSYGHEEGDLVLKHLVRTIKTNIRSGNKVIRQGGGSSPAVTIPDFRAQVSSRPGSPLVCLITDKKKPQQVKICYPFFMNTEELAEKVRSAASEQFSRSGGPGGQNVNKVNTQVTLRIPVCLLGLSEEELTRLTGRLGKRINAAGELIIQSSETRSQTANRERALERAVLLISGALAPVRRRRPTRPSTGSKQRRLKRKKIRSDRKQSRRPPGEE